MTHTRREATISTRDDDDPGHDVPGVSDERFKEAMVRWASTVTVVAVRDSDDGRVHATTATSFAPVSAEPPEVVISLNPSAQALPFVREGGGVGISLLSEDQGRWATVFADSFPVGPMPWREHGVPLIPDATAALEGRVRAVHATEGGSRLVVVRVEEIELGPSDRPLLYWAREYGRLADG